VLSGHTRAVRAVAWGAGGATLATADGRVRLWNVGDGQEPVARFAAGSDALAELVFHVAFSPDGSVVAGTRMYGVHLWDPYTGDEVRRWGVPGATALAFTPDGAGMAATVGDETIPIWDVRDGREVRRLIAPTSCVSSAGSTVAFSPDGTLLAKGAETGGDDVYLWHVPTGRFSRLRGHTGEVVAVAFHPDGSRLASAGLDGHLVLWDPNTGGRLALVADHACEVLAVAFSRDGRWLATGDSSGTVALRDPRTGKRTGTLAHPGPVRSIAFSPDSSRLATACDDRVVRLWNPLATSGGWEKSGRVTDQGRGR
jgi:WD40 repeat protein